PPRSPLATSTCLSSQRLTHRRVLHSFPTRRSSDLPAPEIATLGILTASEEQLQLYDDNDLRKDLFFRTFNDAPVFVGTYSGMGLDRKSTRLNSSHVKSSYAVFCLKKKTTRKTPRTI